MKVTPDLLAIYRDEEFVPAPLDLKSFRENRYAPEIAPQGVAYATPREAGLAIVNARLQGLPIPAEAVEFMKPFWREQKVHTLEKELELLDDEFRFDLWSLEDVCRIEGVKTPEGVEASRLILIQAYEEDVERVSRRLRTLTADGTGEITPEMISKAREYPCEEILRDRIWKDSGRRKITNCPFHDDGKQKLNVLNNRWKCWHGCGEGDAIDFARRVNGWSFPEAVKRLAGLA